MQRTEHNARQRYIPTIVPICYIVFIKSINYLNETFLRNILFTIILIGKVNKKCVIYNYIFFGR